MDFPQVGDIAIVSREDAEHVDREEYRLQGFQCEEAVDHDLGDRAVLRKGNVVDIYMSCEMLA